MNLITSRLIGALLIVNAFLFVQTPIYSALKAQSVEAGATIGLSVIFAMILVVLNLGCAVYVLMQKPDTRRAEANHGAAIKRPSERE
jgi:hypothetical protein